MEVMPAGLDFAAYRDQCAGDETCLGPTSCNKLPNGFAFSGRIHSDRSHQ